MSEREIDGRALEVLAECEEDALLTFSEHGMPFALAKWQVGKTIADFEFAAKHLCQSPIEQTLLVALLFESYAYRSEPVAIWDERCPYREDCAEVVIKPQHFLLQYTVDFGISVDIMGARVNVVVECDGHDFHEKTKEQARRDKKRDRDLQSIGWRVLRFTGSEIWKNPRNCARQVGDVVSYDIEAEMKRRGMIS